MGMTLDSPNLLRNPALISLMVEWTDGVGNPRYPSAEGMAWPRLTSARWRKIIREAGEREPRVLWVRGLPLT
jgi:hypothetical protein